MEPSLTPLLVCCGLMFVLGLADDVRAIAPGTKLVGQMVIAGIVVLMAGPISITGWPVIDQLLAFMWIIASRTPSICWITWMGSLPASPRLPAFAT